MRSLTLAGIGGNPPGGQTCDIDVLKLAAFPQSWQPFSPHPTFKRGMGDITSDAGSALEEAGAAAWEAVKSFISENAVPWLMDLLQIGPSYDAENGGEVARQMTGTGQIGSPWCNAYMDWVKRYRPNLWNGGDIWTAQGYGHPSRFHDKYVTYVAAGMPDGTLMDANMLPVGLGAVVAAVQATQAAGSGSPTAAPLSAQTMAMLNLLAIDYCGANGPEKQLQARSRSKNLPKPQYAYFLRMVQAWQLSNTANGGGNVTQQAGGSSLLTLAVIVGGAMVLSNQH